MSLSRNFISFLKKSFAQAKVLFLACFLTFSTSKNVAYERQKNAKK